jgi:5S rRNA maturation endonuclease (ribonuclease M5)
LRESPIRKFILATDNDERGMKARERIKKMVPNKIFTEIIYPKDVKDPGDCYSEELDNILDWERL